MRKMLMFTFILAFILSVSCFVAIRTGHLGKLQTAKASPGNEHETSAIKVPVNVRNADSPSTPSPAPEIKSKYLVAIDAGHGGEDPGTSGNGLVEKDIALDICQRLDALLKKAGVNTYMVRTGDTYMDHKDRIERANEKNATLFVSVHCDWFENSSYGGTQTLYYPSKDLKAGNLNEIQYAEIIQSELIKVMQTNNRGIMDRPNLAVLRRAQMPSVLVELGFLSNKNDVARLGSPEFRQKIAEGFTNGIMKALEKVKN